MNESKQIDVNSASIVDLKAELYRKQESFRLKKLSQSQQQVIENDTNQYQVNCNQIKYKLGKRIREKGDKELIANNKRKNGSNQAEDQFVSKLSEEDIELQKALQKSRQMLEMKSQLYDKWSKNPNLLNNGNEDSEDETDRILVDFHRKAIHESHNSYNIETDSQEVVVEEDDDDNEEWTEFVDSLGRSRKCLKKDLNNFLEVDRQTFGRRSNDVSTKTPVSTDLSSVPHLSKNNELLTDDLRRELERRDWETNARNEVSNERQSEGLNANNLNIHYQNVQQNEIRDHGVAYYAFAEDQTTRQQQMDLLKEIRDQTMTRKGQKQRLKQKRKQLMRERLAKVAQRKGIAFEPKESSTESEESDVELALPEPKPIPSSVREWDVGKQDLHQVLTEMKPKPTLKSHKTYVEELRDKRNAEFAPPSIYNQTHSKNNFRDKRTNFKSEKPKFIQNTEREANTGSESTDIKVNYNKTSLNIDSNEGKQDVNQVITNALSYFRNNLKQ